MRKPRIYIIGPFRGATEYDRRSNIARAEDAAIDVAKAGAFYRCPHLHSAHFEGLLTDEYWLGLGIDLLSECDAAYLVPDAADAPMCTGGTGPQRAYLLPRWLSRGSAAEVAWCVARGIPAFDSIRQVELLVAKKAPDAR